MLTWNSIFWVYFRFLEATLATWKCSTSSSFYSYCKKFDFFLEGALSFLLSIVCVFHLHQTLNSVATIACCKLADTSVISLLHFQRLPTNLLSLPLLPTSIPLLLCISIWPASIPAAPNQLPRPLLAASPLLHRHCPHHRTPAYTRTKNIWFLFLCMR